MQNRKFTALVGSLLNASLLLVLLANSMLAAPLYQQSGETQVSTIQHIRERGNRLIAGVKYDFPPFGFEDTNGQPIGFDVDLIKAFAEAWGVEPEFVKVTADARIPLLVNGEIDIVAASMTHTQGREAQIDFSQTYFVDGQTLLVRRNSGINDLSDLKGKRIGAIQGTTSIQQISTYAKAQGITVEIVPFPEYLPALEAVNTGAIEALTSDRTALAQFAKDDANLQVIGEPFTQEPYGFGVQAGDSFFRHLVDATLQQMKLSGKYDEIYKKWFPSLSPYPIEILPGHWKHNLADSPAQFTMPQRSIVAQIQREHQFSAGILVDSRPFSFLDETGKCCVGLGVDLIKEFAKRWTGNENGVKYIPLMSSKLTNDLDLKNRDILAVSLPNTWQLEEVMDFSQTYFQNAQSSLLEGGVSISGTNYLTAPVAMGLPQYDAQFRDLVNFTLQTMVQDGTYQRIYQKWFPGHTTYPIEIWPGAPTDPFLLNMIKPTANSVTATSTPTPINTPITTTSTPAIFPTATRIVTSTFITETPATISTTSRPRTPIPTLTAALQQSIPTEPTPASLPGTGASSRAYSFIPYIALLIILLLGGSIYQKRRSYR